MSGLAGVISQGPELPPGTLGAMCAGLSSRRLQAASRDARIMAAHAGEPASQGGCQVFADARLVDRDALCGRLSAPQYTPDPMLILLAWQRWAEDCVLYLTGDFAFCVVDDGQVFCARDHLGVKPFYYYLDNDRFVFASEAKPVADVAGSGLNENRIADYLVATMEHVDLASTFYKGVYRLPPATCLTIRQGRMRERRYWQPRVEAGPGDEPTCLARFLELLQQAIAERQRGGEFAISLSGGVDSSLLAAVAGGFMPVRSFSTLAPPDVDCAESAHIRTLLRHLDIKATCISPDQLTTHAEPLLALFSDVQEPFDANMLQMLLIYRMAADEGLGSLADGVEGDLLYSLPSNYPALLLRAGALAAGAHEARAMASGTREFARMILQALRPAWTKPFRQGHPGLGSLIAPSFAEATDTPARLRAMREAPPAHDLAGACVRQALHQGIPVALERYDRTAARCGIEARHPLVDVRLVEFALSLPWQMRSRDGWSKYLLRAAGQDRVPASVSWQTGKPENAYWINRWFLDQFRDRMVETVAGSADRLSRYVARGCLNDPEDATLWRLYVLASWLGRQ